MGKLTENEIQQVVDTFIDMAGEADLFGPYMDESKQISPEELRNQIFRAKDATFDYGNAVETGDYSKVEGLVDHILEHTVQDSPAKGSDEYKLICQKAAKAMQDKWEKYERYHTERLSRVLNAIGGEMAALSLSHPATNIQPVDKSSAIDLEQDQYKKLCEVIPPFIEEKRESNLTEKYIEDLESSLNLFVEFAGDVEIQSVKRTKIAEYKSTLRKLPPRFGIKPEYRDKSITQLAEMSHKAVLKPGRINKYLERVG